jgi:hypothetical protein
MTHVYYTPSWCMQNLARDGRRSCSVSAQVEGILCAFVSVYSPVPIGPTLILIVDIRLPHPSLEILSTLIHPLRIDDGAIGLGRYSASQLLVFNCIARFTYHFDSGVWGLLSKCVGGLDVEMSCRDVASVDIPPNLQKC